MKLKCLKNVNTNILFGFLFFFTLSSCFISPFPPCVFAISVFSLTLRFGEHILLVLHSFILSLTLLSSSSSSFSPSSISFSPSSSSFASSSSSFSPSSSSFASSSSSFSLLFQLFLSPLPALSLLLMKHYLLLCRFSFFLALSLPHVKPFLSLISPFYPSLFLFLFLPFVFKLFLFSQGNILSFQPLFFLSPFSLFFFLRELSLPPSPFSSSSSSFSQSSSSLSFSSALSSPLRETFSLPLSPFSSSSSPFSSTSTLSLPLPTICLSLFYRASSSSSCPLFLALSSSFSSSSSPFSSSSTLSLPLPTICLSVLELPLPLPLPVPSF
jgi:hypothetical protein